MDNDYDHIFQELDATQTKIMSIFKDLWNECNHYRKTVDAIRNKYSNLLAEHTRVCKEIHSLKSTNNKLNQLIFSFLHFISDLDYSKDNSNETLIAALEKIKDKITTALTNKHNLTSINENIATHMPKNSQQDTPTLSTCFSASHLSSSPEKPQIHQRGERVTLMKNKNADCRNARQTAHSSARENKIAENCFPSPSKTSNLNFTDESKSPVLSNLGRKQLHPNKDDKLFEGRGTDGEKKMALPLGKEKFLVEPTGNMFNSPLKRTSNEAEELSKSCESTPKRCRTTIRRGWKKSPSSQSKKSNVTDGTKKMTQTLLNIDLFKVKSPDKGNISKSSPSARSSKVSLNVEEDDLILESPRILGALEGAAAFRKLNNSGSSGAEKTTDAIDLDETYVPAEIIETCKLTDGRAWKPENSLKQEMFHLRGKSPEYDSVPYIYKREIDKKEKSNTGKPSCLDCLKYFNFGENTQADNNAMDFCSKHRKGNKRNVDTEDTPPGYWKPYLTNSIMSLSDEETG